MMFKRFPGLGLVPAWQMSTDSAVNPHINPHVQYPEGMTQQTIQPVGTHWGQGLGRLTAKTVVDKCCEENQPCCWDAAARSAQLRGLGIDNPFDSWWWVNRKPLVVGSVAVVGLALIAGLAAALR